MAKNKWRTGRPNATQIRIRSLFNELDKGVNEARKAAILAEISALKANALVPSNLNEGWFRCLTGKNFDEHRLRELRTLLAGTQTITNTEGGAGGYLVPQDIQETLILGMAQYDPLLDEDVVTLIESDSYTARPVTVPGWDLSTIAAARVVEGAFHSYATTPSAAKVMLNAFPYRVAMDASFEWENDSFASGMDLFVLAFAFAFARGIGADLINGNGSTGPTGQPRGILTGAAVSGVSLDPTITNDVSNTLNDAFQDAYFSVNRAYRAMPKCGWVMSDTTYQWVRKLTDKNGRPLLNIKADKEELMGKPVFVSPSLPSYAASPSTVGKIIFGDLSHFVVRISQAQIGRYLQTANGSGADFGKELFVGRMRADCNVLDPTGGSTPAIVSIDVQP